MLDEACAGGRKGPLIRRIRATFSLEGRRGTFFWLPLNDLVLVKQGRLHHFGFLHPRQMKQRIAAIDDW